MYKHHITWSRYLKGSTVLTSYYYIYYVCEISIEKLVTASCPMVLSVVHGTLNNYTEVNQNVTQLYLRDHFFDSNVEENKIHRDLSL